MHFSMNKLLFTFAIFTLISVVKSTDHKNGDSPAALPGSPRGINRKSKIATLAKAFEKEQPGGKPNPTEEKPQRNHGQNTGKFATAKVQLPRPPPPKMPNGWNRRAESAVKPANHNSMTGNTFGGSPHSLGRHQTSLGQTGLPFHMPQFVSKPKDLTNVPHLVVLVWPTTLRGKAKVQLDGNGAADGGEYAIGEGGFFEVPLGKEHLKEVAKFVENGKLPFVARVDVQVELANGQGAAAPMFTATNVHMGRTLVLNMDTRVAFEGSLMDILLLQQHDGTRLDQTMNKLEAQLEEIGKKMEAKIETMANEFSALAEEKIAESAKEQQKHIDSASGSARGNIKNVEKEVENGNKLLVAHDAQIVVKEQELGRKIAEIKVESQTIAKGVVGLEGEERAQLEEVGGKMRARIVDDFRAEKSKFDEIGRTLKNFEEGIDKFTAQQKSTFANVNQKAAKIVEKGKEMSQFVEVEMHGGIGKVDGAVKRGEGAAKVVDEKVENMGGENRDLLEKFVGKPNENVLIEVTDEKTANGLLTLLLEEFAAIVRLHSPSPRPMHGAFVANNAGLVRVKRHAINA